MHLKELADRDGKIKMMKMHMADALKDNSRWSCVSTTFQFLWQEKNVFFFYNNNNNNNIDLFFMAYSSKIMVFVLVLN